MKLRPGGLSLVGDAPALAGVRVKAHSHGPLVSLAQERSAKAVEKGLDVDFSKKDKTPDPLPATSQ